MRVWQEPRLRLIISPGLVEKSPGNEGLARREALKVAYTAIEEHERELCLRMIHGMTEIDGLKIWGITNPERELRKDPPPYLSPIPR